MTSFLRCTPRILSILVILFFILFAFDEPIFSFAFLIHLIPAFIISVITFFSWKKTQFGALFFLLLFITSLFFFQTYRYLVSFLCVSFPFLLISLLFFLDSRKK